MVAEAEPAEALLKAGALRLRGAGVETARLDARILLAEATGREPAAILPGDETPVDADAQAAFDRMIGRRAAGEPVSRIIGRREFFGRSFDIGPGVLDPRPDSESAVELALSLCADDARVLDLGTGSGCLILTILAERPGASGAAVDISPDALNVAQENARSLGLLERCSFHEGAWFAPVEGRFDLIVSNPPYIASPEIAELMIEVRDHDPLLALDGGADGLTAYRTILAAAPAYLTPGGHAVFEIGAGQLEDVIAIAEAAGLAPAGQSTDLGGHVRAVAFTIPS